MLFCSAFRALFKWHILMHSKAHAQQQVHQNQYDQDQARIAFLEQNVANISNALQHMQNNIPVPVPQQIFHPNLNLPPPPSYSGSPLQLPTFKKKLIHFLVGNRNTYPDSESQLLYAGQLLEGPAYQWYQSIVDPNTFQLHPSYDLHRFFLELRTFLGERSLSTRVSALWICYAKWDPCQIWPLHFKKLHTASPPSGQITP